MSDGPSRTASGGAPAGPARLGTRDRLRLRLADAGRAFVGLAGATLGFAIASATVPGFRLHGWPATVTAAVLFMASGALFRPVLVRVAARLGWPGAVLLALLGQTVVVWAIARGDAGSGPGLLLASFAAAWIIAGVTTVLMWVFTAGTDEAVTASLVRRAMRRRSRGRQARPPDADVPGVVFVQADGVPYPVLELMVMAGTLPTLSRWVRSGSHVMREWRPRLPATTPASQMGLLHGTTDGIPAFRWVDRASGRVYVANRPADARAVEALHSDGHGLLADDGVSVSNLFTGDAPVAYATMSAVDRTQETLATRRAVSRFLARPDGLARGLSRTVAEIVRERFQAARARRRDLRPRVHRGWAFAVERAALNGVLRDLNTSLVATSMLEGRRCVYVDYVDYDAVAHHAGMLRPESLDALAGIDAVLAQLEKVAAVAPRPYRFVVLSDHGLSQGEIFADRYGEDLAALVARLAHAGVTDATTGSEGAGRLGAVTASAGSVDTAFGRALHAAGDRIERRGNADADRATATQEAAVAGRDGRPGDDEFLVFGSGNLGLVYVAGEDHRLSREELDARFPALVTGLVTHPGVGFAVVRSDEHGIVAVGPDGEHRVERGEVLGLDPLAPFGEHAAAFVARAAAMPEAPDVLVNSLIDAMGEVAAFEGLVGCHGGLGGWQDRAMLVHPADLPAPDGLVVGADTLHAVLVGWLDRLGHRRALPPRRERPYAAARARGLSGPDGSGQDPPA